MFKEKVLQVVKNIPRGQTLTYKQVAVLAGYPKAARAVGSLLKKNSDISVPCHRVIKSDGTPGHYNGLLGSSKEELLSKECNT